MEQTPASQFIEGTLLRIFLGEMDRHDGKPLYEWITLKARDLDLAGVTVLRGILGYGSTHRLHSARPLRLSEDLPLVVEIVDSDEKINLLLSHLEEAEIDCAMTLEKARILKRRSTAGENES